MTAGQFMRCEREARGMTQKVLAEAAGYSVRFIRDIESGNKKLSRKLLPFIATIFECNVGDIEKYDGISKAYSRNPHMHIIGAKAINRKRTRVLCGECKQWLPGKRSFEKSRSGICKKTRKQTTRCDWCTAHE